MKLFLESIVTPLTLATLSSEQKHTLLQSHEEAAKREKVKLEFSATRETSYFSLNR